ncbi:MAG: COX15/CtaA family protein [Pseudomonadota bacterium]
MSSNPDHDRAVQHWLTVCLFLVFAMIILGGATRLTGSGLSMVNWHPTGTLPPLTLAQWQAEFELYQQYPEYQLLNQDMTLDGFKSIFWFEYAHRMLGRLIGLVFLLPLLYFWFRKMIRPGMLPRLIVMFFLGGFQGLLGWYMVKSGLVNNPAVSQYRLTAHLLSALVIYAFIFWTLLDVAINRPYQKLRDSSVTRWRFMSIGLLTLLLVTIVSGGFVAGLKAGQIFNTFPLMGGRLVPEGIGALSPWYMNAFENMVAVQFNHRWLAISIGVLLVIWYWKGRTCFNEPQLQKSFKWIGMMVIIQLILGISTLLTQVPVVLGVLHQAGALLLLTALVFNIYQLSRR